MHDANCADADHVRKPGPRVRLLPHARLAAQLAGDFRNLPGAGRPDRMTHREQSARRAERATAADVSRAAGHHRGAFALLAQAERFRVQQLLDRKCVVHFDYVEIGGRDRRLRVRLRNRGAREFSVEVRGAAIDALGLRD